VGFLSGAQVDRYGNLNSTVVGSYAHPKVRLPGSGGATEIATSCQRVFIVMRHGVRAFVDKLDFLTSLGHGPTGRERRALGVQTEGPVLIVTDLCTMRPHRQTNEFEVTSLHPGVSRDRVRQQTAWDVRFHSQVDETAPPAPEELDALRDLLQRTARAHGASHANE
jgi:glutaconate CoA-transferase subunit B